MLGLCLSLSLSPTGPGGIRPPQGYLFVVDTDGAYLIDVDGSYLIVPI